MPEDRRLMWICVVLAIASLAMLYIALHWRAS
jgi:hypothetical protein